MFRKAKSGFNAETKDKLLTGAGAYFKNFVYGVDTYESAKAAGKLVGATQGGGEFKATPSIRQIEVDGVAGKAKGLEVIDSWEVSMAMNLLETTEDSLKMSLGIASIDSETDGSYHIIQGNNMIGDEHYIDNITYVGTITGSNEPVIIQVFNALSSDGLTLKTEDKKEAVLAVTVYGHYTEEDLDNPPFKIYYPKKNKLATPVASVKSGTYTSEQTVTLTSEEGAEIYYTVNGFEPTQNDTKYTSAIKVSSNTILKAKAFKESKTDSSTLTEIYKIAAE